jgi:hypothetical protein
MRNNEPKEDKLFETMCMIAPDLAYLRGEAEMILQDDNDPDFWENYGNVKSKITKLVGFRAPKSFPEYMHTANSYDVVIRKVFSGLV